MCEECVRVCGDAVCVQQRQNAFSRPSAALQSHGFGDGVKDVSADAWKSGREAHITCSDQSTARCHRSSCCTGRQAGSTAPCLQREDATFALLVLVRGERGSRAAAWPLSPRPIVHVPQPILRVRMRVRAHVRCQCTHFEADWCRDGRERDDLVIRCRCGPDGCISGRRAKSTRASSNPVSECASDHALTSWSVLRLHLCRPLLGLACTIQRASPGRLEGLLRGFCSPPRKAATVR